MSVLTNDDLQDEEGGEGFQSGEEREGSRNESSSGKGKGSKKTMKRPPSVSQNSEHSLGGGRGIDEVVGVVFEDAQAPPHNDMQPTGNGGLSGGLSKLVSSLSR